MENPRMKRVVMTGGTGALGSALVAALVARGALVGTTVRATSAPLPSPEVITERVDLEEGPAVAPAVQALARRLGGVDVFIHAAVLTEGSWDAMLAVNVRAAFFAISALREQLAHGDVVLLGSVGAIKAMESPVVLTASHGALVGLARALAKDLGAQRTRVNLVALGPLTEGASRAISPELRAEYIKHGCLRRSASPAEAAASISAFALSNSYVTGQTVVLDGGL